jgi:hypothetical protein
MGDSTTLYREITEHAAKPIARAALLNADFALLFTSSIAWKETAQQSSTRERSPGWRVVGHRLGRLPLMQCPPASKRATGAGKIRGCAVLFCFVPPPYLCGAIPSSPGALPAHRGNDTRRLRNEQLETETRVAEHLKNQYAAKAVQRSLRTGIWAARTMGLLAGLLGRNRDGQSFATFVATPFEYLSSAGGSHPGQKAVSPFASAVVGLISPFHRSRPIPASSKLVLRLSLRIEMASETEWFGSDDLKKSISPYWGNLSKLPQHAATSKDTIIIR